MNNLLFPRMKARSVKFLYKITKENQRKLLDKSYLFCYTTSVVSLC